MRKRLFAVACAAVMAFMFQSCGDIISEYSTHPCYFVFETSRHGEPTTLGSAVHGVGIFCKVTTEIKGGAKNFRFSTNASNQVDDVPFNALDNSRTVLLGMNNAIWFGYGNLDIPAVFYAYDAQCPVCYTGTGIVDRVLTIDSRGMATCRNCNRTYDLNNGGFIQSGGQSTDATNKLVRYHASTTGAFGQLFVGN